MKAALGKGWKWLLGIFMSLLGFSGCGKIGIFREEYGSPYANFKLLGDVKDMKGNPIRGIRVVYDRLPEDETWQVEVIDTWNMTIDNRGVRSGKFRVELTGEPYMAIRLKKVPG